MPFFTTRRERRLWMVALAVQLANYGTLGLGVACHGTARLAARCRLHALAALTAIVATLVPERVRRDRPAQ